MSRTTVKQVENIQQAINSAHTWYNITITDQVCDYIMERLALHRDLPTLIKAAQYQLDEIQGIIQEDKSEEAS